MEIIDLRKTRCPLSLVILKRYLLEKEKLLKSGKTRICMLFSNELAMQDIILYLDKKGYDYSTSVKDNQLLLFMQLK
jgi:TusA-related sulfurtransferase